MTKLFSILAILSLSVVTASGTEQGTVDHCAAIVRDFRQMPERGIPRDVLRHSKALAIMTVVKAAFLLSGKGGRGVVVGRTRQGWFAPSCIGSCGAGWCL